MRSLHNVADSFLVEDDTYIVPCAGNMPFPALYVQKRFVIASRFNDEAIRFLVRQVMPFRGNGLLRFARYDSGLFCSFQVLPLQVRKSGYGVYVAASL